MWIYIQSSGDFFRNGSYIETGYSGKLPDGRNNPSKECVINVGPIPCGYYQIMPDTSSPSPMSLPLNARDPNYCKPARSGFLIHGDKSTGDASTGCIILSPSTRRIVRDSDDKLLRVVRDSVRSQMIKSRTYA
jgi:hypothetical protein